MDGQVYPLNEIEDKAFASGAMGQGFAIDMTNGLVHAPCDGQIVMIFPTGHALGMRDNYGHEILIHLGMDTVELNGEGFEILTQANDFVKAGDPLIKVDLDVVRKANKSLVSPVVVTSGQNVKLLAHGQVQANQEAALIEK